MKPWSEKRLLNLLNHHWNRRTLNWMSWLCEEFLFKRCFSKIDIHGLETVRNKARAGKRLIFIPNHQSEYDWLLLQNALFLNGVKTAIQAGDNLFVGPLEQVLKRCGAFMSIREERKIYAPHWVGNYVMKLLGGKPRVITREQYGRVYLKQLERILGEEGFNLLIFPGYETDPYTGKVKYGRSYSGEFSPLSPHIFTMVSKALRVLGIEDAEYIPVNITYERVPEDILFRKFKAESRSLKIAKYVYDHYYTFFKAPFLKELHQAKGRVCVRFGAGIPARFQQRSKEFAELMRRRIGELMRVYESVIVFGSLENQFRIPKRELRQSIARNLELLEAKGIDCSPVVDRNGRPHRLDRLLSRVARLFNHAKIPIIPLKAYLTLEHDRNEVFIYHPHLAAYYGNKLQYFLNGNQP